MGYQVVTKLCALLKNQGYNVYFDNFFMSGPLLDDLLVNYGVYACGMTTANRPGFPPEFKNTNAQWKKNSQKRRYEVVQGRK